MATSRSNKTISAFKSKLTGGGARPNLFEVQLTNLPSNVATNWDAEIFQFMCKAASLPAQNIANIDIPFRGRIFKVAGDRTIEPWSITVINDENFQIRNSMEAWIEKMAKLSNNIGNVSPDSYMVTAEVFQLARGGNLGNSDNKAVDNGSENKILKGYKFLDIFPTSVSAIDLSYDSSDAIEEFTVEFQVNSFEVISNAAANG